MRWPEDCSRKAEWSSQAGESVWICWCRWSNLPGHVGRLCPLQTCLRVWKWWFDLLETAILIRKIPMNHQIWKLFGYGSILIHTIFSGMNIHLPAILMFTRGTRFWHTAIFRQSHVKSHGGKATQRFPQRKSIPMIPVDPVDPAQDLLTGLSKEETEKKIEEPGFCWINHG